jgi:FKBP-type peptidyl-prolyl cis-trans isomerase
VWLLDGTFCYEQDSLHPVTFMPGKGQQPRGLEEGLLMMQVGSRARLVLPAHLAFGTAGDGRKIPGNAALYYDVQLFPTDETR